MLKIYFIILLLISQSSFSAEQKMVAFTCDDVPHAGPNIPMSDITSSNKKLLSVLKNNQIPCIGFVNEKLIFQFPVESKQRIGILQLWLDEGFELGNHTYSHWSMMDVPLKEYEADVLRNEVASGTLMAQKGLKLRYFRHPFLITGPTLEYKEQFEKFLANHGYAVAPVTIEFLDHEYNLIYSAAKQSNDIATMERVVKEYIEFAHEKIDFFENFSQKLLGYQVKQILLFHDNELNADHIQDIINIFKDKGYAFITVAEALTDKPYQLPDKYYGPQGESWLFHWALRAGKLQEFNVLPEPQPSKFITNTFQELSKKQGGTVYQNAQ
jgi:peptidoglycan/xylan/chitin deacetylase (PgdA/CDA1 family)